MIPRVAASLAAAIASTAVLTLVQIGLCHLIAKVFLKATGSFVKVLRPLLLGWFVNLLVLVPVVGPIAAAIAWSAVLMLVFEEVDGIGRVPAFVIAYGVNMGLFVLQALAVHYWLAGLR